MDNKNITNFNKILKACPPDVKDQFTKSRPHLEECLNQEQMYAWVDSGIKIASQSNNSWDTTVNLFRVSPIIIGMLKPDDFMNWLDTGVDLTTQYPVLGTGYFSASPSVLRILPATKINDWASLGSKLYQGTWKSGTLSNRFFESSGDLLEQLDFNQLTRFVDFLNIVAKHSYDLSSECLTLALRLFPLVGNDKDRFISLSLNLVETGWRQLKAFYDASLKSLPRVDASQRKRFLDLSERLHISGIPNMPNTILEISQALQLIEKRDHTKLFDIADPLLDLYPSSFPEFIKSSPVVLGKVSFDQLSAWCEEGKALLQTNPEGGLAFFKIESSRSEKFLEQISSAVEYQTISNLIELYCRALAGEEISLADSRELVEKNIGWVAADSPTTEGSTVYLPEAIDRYSKKSDNFLWYKVVSTHQVGRMEFGSFRFSFNKPSDRFENARILLETGSTNGKDSGISAATDIQKFFNFFEERQLSLDIFSVIEDGRIDAKIKDEYKGISKGYIYIQSDALKSRPDTRDLKAREALLELLVQISLGQSKSIPIPVNYQDQAQEVVKIARHAMDAKSSVEDTAEATIRIYRILIDVVNDEVDEDDWDPLDFEDEESEGDNFSDPEGFKQSLDSMGNSAGDDPADTLEEKYNSPQEVDYRGEFKPELTQLLEKLREQGQFKEGDNDSESITQEMMDEFAQNTVELSQELNEGVGSITSDEVVENMLKEVGLQKPESLEGGQGPLVHVDETGGELESDEPETFVYDEWDFRAGDYKPRWCIVRQKYMAEGEDAYYGNIVQSYGNLVMQVRRQFELLVPETMRKQRRLQDGEDIDIDDVIETMVDIKTGSSPNEKMYWRRNKVHRDVAVIFLLDTSASTAEAIDDSKAVSDQSTAPDDPVEYMLWLRSRRGEGTKRTYKRIIDLEKEALILLINAIEAIGDTYGIYGFSGYGRENVEFYTVKDLDELFSDKVKRRIDRIAPLHATRMGPAIRHSTSKLESLDARTKLMFLISDGRPQDRGYSREGVEKEYAVHDTRMALDEARSKGINPFCLTVDRNGHDYLKTMMSEMGYEVLDDIHALPHRLLYLYRKLTT
ncbi:MAG: nitric oxide reductase activation protein NorD [Dehalococcoidia bacterium]|nr:hypothetical protein [Chloroflexota bacterium]